MTHQEFFNKFNQTAPSLQSEALELTENMEQARRLYQETAHHAMKYHSHIEADTSFELWASNLMHHIYSQKFHS